MQVAGRFVGAAVGAVLALAGCGGGGAGDGEPEAAAFLEDAADDEQAAELRAALEGGTVAALAGCRAGRTCRLSGSVVDRGSGQFTVTGCSAVTASSSGRAILNASFTGSLQRPGRYVVRVSSGTYRFDTTVSSMTCSLPGGGSFTVPGNTNSHVVAARSGNVTVVSDGRNLTVTGNMVGSVPPGCTGGNRYTGTVIGLANPMVTLRGSMTCTIGSGHFTVTSTVKLVGAP